MFARNARLAVAKNILLAYIIGNIILLCMLLGVVGNESVILFNTSSAAPDFLFLGLAVCGYLKGK